MMPGNASTAFLPNLPNKLANALSLFLIHSFKPVSCLGRGLSAVPPPATVSTKTLMAIPIAIIMEAIVIPCSQKSILIILSNEVSLYNTLAIVSLKLLIWLVCLPLRRSMLSCFVFGS